MNIIIQGDAPKYAHHGDAGADLTAYEDCEVPAYGTAKIRTGLAVAIPVGFVGYVMSRSGLAANHGVRVFNAPGVIDAGYRGEIGVLLENTSPLRFAVKKGAKIAQLIVQEVQRVSFYPIEELPESLRGDFEFSSTARGTGGFGSTGF